MNFKRKTFLFAILLAAFSFQSCDKMLELEPEDVIEAETALQTPEDMQRLLNSCYDVLGNVYDGNIQVMAELMGNNVSEPVNNNDLQSVYGRATDFFNSSVGARYTDLYRTIFRVNTLLTSFDLIEGLSSSERTRIEAEARFIRALCHWQVAMIWAQPYGYTPNNTHLGIVVREEPTNDALPRTSLADAYDLILSDLSFARSNLPAENGNYANSYGAHGLSAIVYMQMMQFEAAATFATTALSGTAVLDSLDRFTPNVSPETIFGIVSLGIDNRNEGLRDNFRSDNNSNPQIGFSDDFINLLNFSPTDTRIEEWVKVATGRYLVKKFDKEIFNIPLVYVTQLKLIRAEALAEVGTDLATARQDVNDIRARAFEGTNLLSESADAETIKQAAREEFRKETVCEGWWTYHLKRFGVMGEDITIRDASWDCPGMALQFPNAESSVAGFVFNPEGGCDQ
jgi:hypothetical protein